jgi:hypothetical protein
MRTSGGPRNCGESTHMRGGSSRGAAGGSATPTRMVSRGAAVLTASLTCSRVSACGVLYSDEGDGEG